MSDAVEWAGVSETAGPFVFMCEHASNRLPLGLTANDRDRALLDDHWGWDIGAANVTRELADKLGCRAILANYSRLVVDPNRDPLDETYIVREVAGQPVSFNQDLDTADRMRRTRELFEPYHAAVDEILTQRVARGPKPHLVSIHSFTPVYRGHKRSMEIGVLFDDFDDDAEKLEAELARSGLQSALNEPYSGKGPGSLIYSAHRHGTAHGIKYLELEVRQDLIDTAGKAREVANLIGSALNVFRPAS